MNNYLSDVVVTGMSVVVPQENMQSIIKKGGFPSEVVHAYDPSVLGNRGLRYKDIATVYALTSVFHALQSINYNQLSSDEKITTSVVVSNVFGNFETVCRAIEVLEKFGHSDYLSMLDAPKASSNVTASNIAIKFRFSGPNITICNGERSGIDAVYFGKNLIRTGRAQRVIIVGVEAITENIGKFVKKIDKKEEINTAAACLVLEKKSLTLNKKVLCCIGDYFRVRTSEFEYKMSRFFCENDDVFLCHSGVNFPNLTSVSLNIFDKLPISKSLFGPLGIFQIIFAINKLPKNDLAIITTGKDKKDSLSTITIYGGKIK